MPTVVYSCPICGHAPQLMGILVGNEQKGYIKAQCCGETLMSFDTTIPKEKPEPVEEIPVPTLTPSGEDMRKAKAEAEAEAQAIADELQRKEDLKQMRLANLARGRKAKAEAKASAETKEEGE